MDSPKSNVLAPRALASRFGLPECLWPIIAPIWLLQLVACGIAVVAGAVRDVLCRALEPLRQTRPGRAFARLSQSELFPSLRIGAALTPADLLGRVPLVRPVLLAIVAVEWLAMFTFGFAVAMGCFLGFSHHWTLIVALMLMVLPAGVGMAVQSYLARLHRIWTQRREFLCAVCGYNLLGSLQRCPECGSCLRPVFPGQLPPQWQAWGPLTGTSGPVTPCALLGSLAPLLMWLQGYLSRPALGAIILSLTISFLAIGAAAVARVATNLAAQLRFRGNPAA